MSSFSMGKVDAIVEAIKSVLPKRRPIEHHEPHYDLLGAGRLIHKSLLLGLNSGYYKATFEDQLLGVTGADHVVLTSSGTDALTIALRAFGIGVHQNSDLVLVPSNTFAATANAVHFAGAIPYFIDTYGPLTPNRLREVLSTTKAKRHLKLRAIIPVHLFGHPLDMRGIMEVANEHNLIVIEDAAQALGSKLDERHVGTFGHAGVFSFNNNKIVTTNGGGAIITDNEPVAARSYDLANTARVHHPWLIDHSEVGWNARMGEINAALGVSQLDHFDSILELKRNLYFKYKVALNGLCDFFEPPEGSESNHWLSTILVDTDDRDEILKRLHADQIRCRRAYTPLHLAPYYKYSNVDSVYWQSDAESDMNRCMKFFEQAICLPSGPDLYSET